MISWLIRPPCEITDQLATAFRLCFTCLILTLKEAPRMHQNAPLPEKNQKILWGEGTAPFPDPFPTREGDTPSQIPPLSRFGARRFPFLFIYDSNTAGGTF